MSFVRSFICWPRGDDLAPRIKELKKRIDELSKTRLLVDAEQVVQGVRHVDRDTVVSYASDLRSWRMVIFPKANSSCGPL